MIAQHSFAIAKKELRSSFNSPLGYLFIVVFLLVMSWLFFQSFFLIGQANMRVYFAYLPWIYLFLLPAVTMKSWAEEKKTGTVELLFTSPIRDEAIVLGKFLGNVVFLALALLLSCTVPFVVMYAGNPDVGIILSSYFGALLLGSSYIAVGMWLSAFTDNQIVAFLMAIVAVFFFYIIGEAFVLQKVPSFLAGFFDQLGLGTHYESMTRGVVDSRDLIYFISFIGFFLFLNVRYITSRRFR